MFSSSFHYNLLNFQAYDYVLNGMPFSQMPYIVLNLHMKYNHTLHRNYSFLMRRDKCIQNLSVKNTSRWDTYTSFLKNRPEYNRWEERLWVQLCAYHVYIRDNRHYRSTRQ